VFLLNSDEEINSPTSGPLIEEEARRSAVSLVLEPAANGLLVTSRKGGGPFRLRVTGRPAHWGSNHRNGVSAVEDLARQVIALHAMTDYGRGTTLNVGAVRGGTLYNVVAAEAEAEVDLRVTTRAEGERMMKVLLGLRPYVKGASVQVTGRMTRIPWEPSEATRRLFESFRAAGRRLGMELEGGPSGGGSDGCITAANGTPTLDGLGVAGFGSHSLEEWVDLDSLPAKAELLAEFLASPTD
jgi:glutamate carboxypeptidase